jgi:hypothetical protein
VEATLIMSGLKKLVVPAVLVMMPSASVPYPTQAGSNTGYPAAGAMLVKDHSESDIRVDPTNPKHLIGSVKWFVSAEGYNHLTGFFESFDGGKTWSTGHIPGYEGWTDNTDPVGAFDGFGNYYELTLPYEFFYDADGTHDYKIGTPLEPNPAQPAEVLAISVRPHGATSASDWITTHDGHPDLVASYDSVGNEPDKPWLTIDDNPASPHYNRVYAMWVDFHHNTAVPYVSFADARADGTHTDWSAPQALPQPPDTPQGGAPGRRAKGRVTARQGCSGGGSSITLSPTLIVPPDRMSARRPPR